MSKVENARTVKEKMVQNAKYYQEEAIDRSDEQAKAEKLNNKHKLMSLRDDK